MRKLLIFILLASSLLAQDAPRITPQRPIEELRREALAAQPPQESGKRAPELVEITTLDPTIKLDIRYATENNFLSTPVYEQARAFLQEPAAKALVRAHRWLKRRGYGLLIHDAYRPWYVTKIFWDATPPEHRSFVADPAGGSRHNRGAAVDLTLYDLKTGQPVEMPSLYDEFSSRAHPTYTGGTQEQRRLRDLLRAAMERHGFKVIENEWWHFDYKDWQKYPILNVAFAEIGTDAPLAYATQEAASIADELRRLSGTPTPPKQHEPSPMPTPPRRDAGPYFGATRMLVLVGPDGRVHEIRILKSGGPGYDANAVEAVRQWRYEPARLNGRAVPARISVQIDLAGIAF